MLSNGKTSLLVNNSALTWWKLQRFHKDTVRSKKRWCLRGHLEKVTLWKCYWTTSFVSDMSDMRRSIMNCCLKSRTASALSIKNAVHPLTALLLSAESYNHLRVKALSFSGGNIVFSQLAQWKIGRLCKNKIEKYMNLNIWGFGPDRFGIQISGCNEGGTYHVCVCSYIAVNHFNWVATIIIKDH